MKVPTKWILVDISATCICDISRFSHLDLVWYLKFFWYFKKLMFAKLTSIVSDISAIYDISKFWQIGGFGLIFQLFVIFQGGFYNLLDERESGSNQMRSDISDFSDILKSWWLQSWLPWRLIFQLFMIFQNFHAMDLVWYFSYLWYFKNGILLIDIISIGCDSSIQVQKQVMVKMTNHVKWVRACPQSGPAQWDRGNPSHTLPLAS